MQMKARRIYRLQEYSQPDIFYLVCLPVLGIFLSLFFGWEIIIFCFLLTGLLSIFILDIDNCYENLDCKYNSTFARIILQQKNVFAQGRLELQLSDIETVLIQSKNSEWTIKNPFGKNIEINNQAYWIVVVLYSGEHRPLTYYQTSLFSNKQKIVDYILFLKDNL